MPPAILLSKKLQKPEKKHRLNYALENPKMYLNLNKVFKYDLQKWCSHSNVPNWPNYKQYFNIIFIAECLCNCWTILIFVLQCNSLNPTEFNMTIYKTIQNKSLLSFAIIVVLLQQLYWKQLMRYIQQYKNAICQQLSACIIAYHKR